MIRFYAPNIESDSTLSEVESGHCCRVLRMHAGEEIEVVDGKGNLYKCIIIDANPKKTLIEIVSKSYLPLPWRPNITLAIAPTKNMDRMEWLLEKSLEIGVNRIIFLNCHNSVRRIVKRERLVKIIISAMKQSLKAIIPEFIEMIDLKYFLNLVKEEDKEGKISKFIGYCDKNIERKEFAKEYDGFSDIIIMIGPEGDFTPEEISLTLESGFKPVTFGDVRLRTETAALYGLCATHTIMTQVN